MLITPQSAAPTRPRRRGRYICDNPSTGSRQHRAVWRQRGRQSCGRRLAHGPRPRRVHAAHADAALPGSRQRLQSRDQPVRIGADQRHRLHPHRTGHGRLHRHVPFVRGRSDQSVFRAAHRARPEQSAAHAGVVRRILPAQRRGRSVRPSPAIGERQRLLYRIHDGIHGYLLNTSAVGLVATTYRIIEHFLDGTPLEPAPGTGTTANAPEGGDAWQDVLGTD